jgi:exopolysaccharide biosynthesis polyprenyl glycosylphosphotransferase
MLKARARLISFFVFIIDILIVIFSFLFSYYLRNNLLPRLFPSDFQTGLYPLKEYTYLLGLIIIIFAFFLRYFKVYKSHRTYPLIYEIWITLKVSLFSFLLLFAFLYLLKWHFVSRPFILLFVLNFFIFLSIEKLIIRFIARILRKKGYNFRNLLIVGNGKRAYEIANIFQKNPHWGIKIVGFLSDGHNTNLNVLGGINEMEKILQNNVIDDVIFAVSKSKLDELEETIMLCQELGINTRIALNIFPKFNSKIHIEEISGVPLLTFTRIPTDVFGLFLKRLVDIFFGSLLFILSFPLMILISIAIKIDSKGPVLFKQIRLGLNGRKFLIYKFRTMFEGAENFKKDVSHLNVMDGPVFKAPSDPRLTKVGKFLRKFSLDELPQLYNVLKGEMSLVGPRPLIPEEIEKFERWQKRRLSMKPGLTCLWQISGRSKLDFETWMKLDLEYIDNWSLKKDFIILLKTIPAVLTGKGAH